MPYWALSSFGLFTVSSACDYLKEMESPNLNDGSNRRLLAWKWKGPERICMFLLQFLHIHILTNSERFRRHLSTSSTCMHCLLEEETVLHVLRDYPLAKAIWLRLIPSGADNFFSNLSTLEWLSFNLSRHNKTDTGVPWATIFEVTCRFLWKWWNSHIFENTIISIEEHLVLIYNFTAAVNNEESVSCLNGSIALNEREEVLVGWTGPPSGWIALNSDEAYRKSTGQVAARGVLRDSNGQWKVAYAMRLRKCTAYRAELWGIFGGLKYAWELGFRQIVLQVDNKLAIQAITSQLRHPCSNSNLIQAIHDILQQQWSVQVHHICREANRVVDFMANEGFSIAQNFLAYNSPPDMSRELLVNHVIGACFPG